MSRIKEIDVWVQINKYGTVFEVSSTGRIVSPERIVTYKNRNGKTVSRPQKRTEYLLCRSKDGYMKTTISVNGKKVYLYAHWLVAEAFHGERPAGMVVNHINGQRHDNRAENLEYVTYAENTAHGFRIGSNKNKGASHPRSTLNGHQIQFIKDNLGKMSQRKLAAICGVGEHIISSIKTGRTFKDRQ